MPEWTEWVIGGSGGLAVARLIWAWLRRTHPLRPSIPLVDRAYRIATSSARLLFCQMGSRQKDQVILDLIAILEQAGIAVDEIQEYRRRYGSSSPGGTGSPFDSWIDGESGSTKALPTTPPSSPSSGPTAPARSKKRP